MSPRRHLIDRPQPIVAPPDLKGGTAPSHTPVRLDVDVAMVRCLVRWAALHDGPHLEGLLRRLPSAQKRTMLLGDEGRRFVDDLCGRLVAEDKHHTLPALEALWVRDHQALLADPAAEPELVAAIGYARQSVSPAAIWAPVFGGGRRHLAEHCLRRGALPFEVYAERFVPSAKTLSRLCRQNIISAAQYMAQPRREPALTHDLVRSGHVPFVALMTEDPTCLDDARPLVATQDGHWESWLSSRGLSDRVLDAGVAQDLFTPAMLHSGGRRLLDALWLHRKMAASALPQAAVATWDAALPMPYYFVPHLRRAPSLNAMLDALPMPSYRGRAENETFTRRCMSLYVQRGSTYCEQSRSDYVVHTASQWWQQVVSLTPPRSRRASTSSSAADLELTLLPRHCMACGDELGPHNPAFKMPRCAHPAAFDRACYERGLESLGGAACITPGCTNALCVEDLLLEDIRGPWVDALPKAVLSRWQTTQPLWRACPTETCPSGRLLAPDSRLGLQCDCCGTHSILSTKAPLFTVLPENSKAHVYYLVQNALMSRTRHFYGASEPFLGMVRECYHCGIPTEHRGGCSQMDCEKCGRRWDFVSGERGHRQSSRPSQMYVPEQSWLVDMGLYLGLKPGGVYSSHVVAQVLRANLLQAEAEQTRGLASEQTRVVPRTSAS